MSAEKINDNIMYFEQMPPHIQDAIIDFIVSIIENKYRIKAGIEQDSEHGSTG